MAIQQPGNVASADGFPVWRRPLQKLALMAGLVILCFSLPLYDLAVFCLHSEFYSYILLIPLITGYLIWIRRDQLGSELRPAWGPAAVAVTAAGATVAVFALAPGISAEADYLALMMGAFLLLLLAAGFASLGVSTLAAMAFPLALLIFMVPYPERLYQGIEAFFQHVSAAAAHGFLFLAGTPCHREGLALNLPNNYPIKAPYVIEVGPTCSGVHSSQVLLITSLLAGNLFLRTTWRRVFLVCLVIPLAILRNGFRIFVISELCVHINHNMIDSWIHRKGGPVFFALSLIPFFFVLVWLRKSESKTPDAVKTPDNT